jgi:hypothetical protein
VAVSGELIATDMGTVIVAGMETAIKAGMEIMIETAAETGASNEEKREDMNKDLIASLNLI